MNKKFKLVSSIIKEQDQLMPLKDNDVPNEDMLIKRANLYTYVPTDKVEEIKEKGISTSPVKVFFSRLPENKYSEFTKKYTPVKITFSKIKKIKDQTVKIVPVNIKGKEVTDSLDEKEVLGLNDGDYRSYFEKGDLENIPHARIYTSRGLLPAFILKFQD